MNKIKEQLAKVPTFKKYQNMEKSQNKAEVAEEIGCGNKLKSCQKMAAKTK